MSGRGRICFHHPYLYPIFSGDTVEFAGGAEVQQGLLARGLSRLGFEVTGVTADYGQPARMDVDGVTLFRSYPVSGGIPILRFFHPRLSRTVAALIRANADVYYVRGSGLFAGVTYDVARLRGAALVLATAHDADVVRSLPLQTNPRDRWWHRRALRGAHTRIVQTEAQRERLQHEFGLASTVVPNAVELPDPPLDPGRRGAVVWLGTYKPAKRPEWFTALARALPEYRFIMSGVIPPPPDTLEAWRSARAAASACPNLEVRGFVPHARLRELFGEACLFVHTSPMEGFPNTLLEAWAHSLPSVTVVDPDGVGRREGLGTVVQDLDTLTHAVRDLMEDPEARRVAGTRARTYVRSEHAPDRTLARLAEILDHAVASVRARRAAPGRMG